MKNILDKLKLGFLIEGWANQGISINLLATFGGRGLPSLRFGDSGLAVSVLQRLLLCNRYFVQADGFFGAVTETAVKAFQNQRNLRPDGLVGSRTWQELAR